jgi:two-component system response regulator CssR
MTYTVHLVEDEQQLNHVLTKYLQQEGWSVNSFINGDQAKKMLDVTPHLWIVDIMLPDMDGYQLLKEIKSKSEHVPVIFISARDHTLDRTIGFEMGCDDYLTKPFIPRELIVRSKIVLQRHYGQTLTADMNQPQTVSYELDLAKRKLFVERKVVELTSKEFDVLAYFLKNEGKALTREQILHYVWGEDYFGSDRAVDDLIHRLRSKVPFLHIETIYGFGYRLEKKT